MAGTFIVLGSGYIGSRVARAALDRGRRVRVATLHPARHEDLRLLGAEVRPLDATKTRAFGPALEGAHGATVVYAVPPMVGVPAGETLARATEAALHIGARSFIFLSSAGLYGDMPDDAWVDEETSTAHDDPAMASYHTDESAVESASFAGLRTCVLRLAAVYGPGRGVRARLRAGDYKLLDGGKHHVSRIHIDDVIRVIFAAEERAPQGSRYLVADDQPSTQLEYAEWLCKRLDLPMPPSVASYAPGMRRTPHRNRRIRNQKMKRELGVTLQYPSFVEGETQIDAFERGETSPPAAAAAPAASAPTTPAAAEARPDFVRNIAQLKVEDWSYPNTDEKHGNEINLAEAVGLQRFGVCLVDLPPGRRSGYPHSHSTEEEFGYVLEGTPDLWIDGKLHRLGPGDVMGFPPGTGINHIVINNTTKPVKMIVVGDRRPGEDRVFYPKNPERQAALKPERAWNDAPQRELGPHDGKPNPK
jgi:uncharacterized cupin superfamily protein/nucleoside-diphosphate-sugar epimerase